MIDEQRLEKLGIVKQEKINQHDYEVAELKFFETNLMDTIERCQNNEVKQVWYKKFNWLQLNINKYINYIRTKQYIKKGKITMDKWLDNKIKKVKQADIQTNEQVMELADNIFFDYIETYPQEKSKLVFWNEKENCGNDTEQGRELYDFIRNSLEDKSEVFHKNENEYYGFIESEE